MKTILLTLTYAVGIGELILAGYFWVTNSKNEIRRVMALLAFSIGIWAITNGMTAYVNPSALVNISLYILFIFGLLSLNFLLYLVIIFPYKNFTFDKLHKVLIFVPSFLVIIVLVTTKTVINNYYVTLDTPGWVIGGPLFAHYQFFLGILFLFSFIVNVYKISQAEGRQKSDLILFLTGSFFAAVPAIIVNTYSSFINNTINPLFVVLPSLVWLATTSYSILRK